MEGTFHNHGFIMHTDEPLNPNFIFRNEDVASYTPTIAFLVSHWTPDRKDQSGMQIVMI